MGDEVVVTKSGKHTYGLGRFFSSLYQQTVPGLAFFGLSLVSKGHAYPVRIEQVTRAPQPQTLPKAQKQQGRGRPKGSKEKDKASVHLNRELLHIKIMITALLELMLGSISPTHLALDGHFGNNYALQMARRAGLHLVSKLRYDSALYLSYHGANSKRKYGQKLNPRHIDEHFAV